GAVRAEQGAAWQQDSQQSKEHRARVAKKRRESLKSAKMHIENLRPKKKGRVRSRTRPPPTLRTSLVRAQGTGRNWTATTFSPWWPPCRCPSAMDHPSHPYKFPGSGIGRPRWC